MTAPAIIASESCPCDSCKFARQCGRELLACSAFSMFLHGSGEPRWQRAPRAPTHARYEALLAERPAA